MSKVAFFYLSFLYRQKVRGELAFDESAQFCFLLYILRLDLAYISQHTTSLSA